MKGKKLGGRAKGTPNKKSVLLDEKAKELGVDPFTILLKFAAGDWEGLGYKNEIFVKETADGKGHSLGYTITPEMRLKAAAEACQYLLAKKKAIELTGGEDAIKIIIEDYSSKK